MHMRNKGGKEEPNVFAGGPRTFRIRNDCLSAFEWFSVSGLSLEHTDVVNR